MRRSGGAVCRRFDDLDAVLESDTSDDFRQLICSIQASPSFDAAIIGLNAISLAIADESEPLVPTVLCRTVAKTLSMGSVVRKCSQCSAGRS